MQRRYLVIFSFFVFVWMIACTKDSKPFEISIASIKDSLTLKPITFSAYVTETPDSYSWDFGDGTTSTSATPQHAYQTMGIFKVACSVKIKDASYAAYYQLKIKGDSRIVGQKRFYGTHFFSTSANQYGIALTFVTRTISDTVLTFTAPSDFKLSVCNLLASWKYDIAGEIFYQDFTFVQVGLHTVNFYYYPAKDSAYIVYRPGDNAIHGDESEYKLYQKK